MPENHLIVGAGAVGQALATHLSSKGDSVTLLSRSGTSMGHPLITTVRLDASDASALATVANQASVIYNCASITYSKWASEWPPLAASILSAAEASGAVLVTASNLYGYANPTSPMTEDSPLRPSSVKGQVRVTMWQEALASHQAGRSLVTEVRGSDYLGANVGANGHMADRLMPKLLKGKNVSYLGNPEAPHSWTSVQDMARAMAVAGSQERALGKAWHAPTSPAMSARELVTLICSVAGIDPVGVKQVPRPILSLMGIFNPEIRELREMFYQFDDPFVIDSSAFTTEFGIKPTPIEETIQRVIDHYR